MQSSFIEFEFGKLHYLHSMSGNAKTVLFLHAVNSSAESYVEVCDLLKEQFNLICLDFPGHGLSKHVNIDLCAQYYSMDGFTSIVIEFITRLKLKNLFIVGDSIGGNIAVRSMPFLKMLGGLILMGSVQAENKESLFALHHSIAPMNLLFQKELTEKECETLAAAYVDPLKNKQKGFMQMLYDIKRTDPNYRELLPSYIETQPWVNELELIQKNTLPLMYILGLQDGFINVPYYKDMLLESGVQESQIHALNQSRHVPSLDNPELCAKLLSEFINKE